MVVGALASILDKAKEAGHLRGIVPHLVGDLGVSLLQYADNTIVMVEGSDDDISNLKLLLLRGYPPDAAQSIADRLNCQLGSFPTAYLGIPISDSRLSVAELYPTVAKLQYCIEPWQGQWLSKAARTVLINSSLSSLLLFLMSFYSLPETLHHEIATVQARFF